LDLTSQNVKRVIKLGRMVWTWYVARTGEKRNTYKIVFGNLKIDTTLEKQMQMLKLIKQYIRS
jgi:hypothetical protein